MDDKILEIYTKHILEDSINFTSFYVPGMKPKVGIFMQNPGKFKVIAKVPVERNDLLDIEAKDFENNNEMILECLKIYREYFVLWLYSNKNFFIPFLQHLGKNFKLEEYKEYIKYDNEEEIGQIFDDFYFFDACKTRKNDRFDRPIVETEIMELGLRYVFCFGNQAFESIQELTGLTIPAKDKGITLQHGKVFHVALKNHKEVKFTIIPVVHMSIYYISFRDCYFSKLKKAFDEVRKFMEG